MKVDTIPPIMLGTYGINGDNVVSVLEAAYGIGYRAIDCGRYYKNEKDWGDAIQKLSIPRSDIFIQTKIDYSQEKKGIDVLSDFEITLENFHTDYIDALLIHWPVLETFRKTWSAMETLYKQGKVRMIGVSNFRPEHYEMLKTTLKVFPMIHQFERHPCRKQPEIYEYCRENNVQPEAYQPLAVCNPHLINNEILVRLARKYSCSVPQIALAWNHQTGVIPLPRSHNPERLKENIEALGIHLEDEEIEEINNDKAHYFRALRESNEFPGYWDHIHKVDINKFLEVKL